MNLNSKIYIAGHLGMVGSAIYRKLIDNGYKNLVAKSSLELDLLNQSDVDNFFENEKPEYIIIAAAKVGGILANNTYRGEFIYNNLMIQNNIIHASHINRVKKLLFLGSSCIYPRNCNQPIKEEYLMSGALESTNEPYAIAKIAGIKLCESYFHQYNDNFICAMPTNLYGKNDNFDLSSSHVLPALIRKFHEAKVSRKKDVEIWGSGNPEREFLLVNDLAEACILLMTNVSADDIYNKMKISHLNIGSGSDISIKELAEKISKIVGYNGNIKFDVSKPDGTPKKLLDVSRINKLGWKAKYTLDVGIKETYDWFLRNYDRIC